MTGTIASTQEPMSLAQAHEWKDLAQKWQARAEKAEAELKVMIERKEFFRQCWEVAEAELAKINAWLPIEMAPKDRAILLYAPDLDSRFVSRWTEEPYPHWRGYNCTPTHWHFLPDTPTLYGPEVQP